MPIVPSEADRLLEAGRRKILRACLLWGVPLLAILVLAGLQYAGAVRLEEYLSTEPDKVDRRFVWTALAVLALPYFLCLALSMLQGWGGIRRARQLRQQSAASKSEGGSREDR